MSTKEIKKDEPWRIRANIIMSNKGDILELVDGREVIFESLGRKDKFNVVIDGVKYSVHLDNIKRTTGKVDKKWLESIQLKTDTWNDLVKGDIFAITEGEKIKKMTFMYVKQLSKNVQAMNIATRKLTRIDIAFKPIKIDLEKTKKEL